jgi:general secretion pathway protein C
LERHGRRLPGLVSLALAILLGIALADLLWALIPLPETAKWRAAPAPALQAKPSGGSNAGAVDIATIQSANLFGQYNPEPTTDLGKVATTNLPLKLIGILASSDNERYSRALIEVQPGDERPFGVGAQVIQGTTLQAILPDRVVLARAGKLEALRLEKDKESAGGGIETSRPEPAPGGSLAQIRDQVLQDPNKAAEFVRVQAANKDGRLQGYRIYPGKDRSVFSQAGLKPGDLVTEVNGVQLDDASKALKMLSELKDVSQLNLVIERGGQSQTINVKMN